MCWKKKKIDRYQYYLNCINASSEQYFQVVNNYIDYYSKRAKKYRRFYFIGCFIKTILLAGILVIQSITEIASMPWIAATASAICLVIETMMGVMHSQEKWELYRNTFNMLMSEQRQYATGCGRYYGEEKKKTFQMFVINVEQLIGDEARKWSEMVQREGQSGGGNN